MTLTSPSEIFVRAYTEKPEKKPVGAKGGFKGDDTPSPWSLTFDCETTIDAAQSLRVGVFQLRDGDELEREGLIYDAAQLSPEDAQAIERFADAKTLETLTTEEFRRLFLEVGYDLRGRIIGFNLPFDISRIAIDHGPARGSMRGGFSFGLTPWKSDPRVRVKHLSARQALIDFARPGKQETPRGMRKKGMKTPYHRGYFLDVKTLAAALTSRSFSLGGLCDFLGTATRKQETEEHGGPITGEYLDYARADVQATWECYQSLDARYAEHGLETQDHRILSEASIGKAYLKQMEIQPLLACQPDTPRDLFGKIMPSYCGGRAEVRIRRVPTQVLYCDFKSMYPTVSALMRLWPFVIGDGFKTFDATAETQGFLDAVTLDDLQDKETWPRLRALVRLKPDGDLLPVRARYDGKINTIGLNHLTCDEPLWCTLADCVASKMLTGKTPQIEEALKFEPGPPQSGLQPIDLFGKPEFRVDPKADDVFTRLIDLRDEAKRNKDPVQQAIKIVANSTSYGIFIEVNRDDAPKPEPLDVYGPDGGALSTTSTAIEQPGRYFHPLLGALITGAARLMLALSERLAADQGLGWVFCDTDSLAMAWPEEMDQEAFLKRGAQVIAWYEGLNPYRKPGSILQIEDVNYRLGSCEIEPLYAFAISAKRYALYNLTSDGSPILRKASAHGLGHLRPPYGEDNAPKNLPNPVASLPQIGVARWQHDIWIKIIEAALGGTPHQVPLDYHPAFQTPCVSRYGATSPRLLKWMEKWNGGKDYAAQIKPFGFLTALTARTGLFAEPGLGEIVEPSRRGRPKKRAESKPVAPFDQDHTIAVANAFDRETGHNVDVTELKTYAEALAQFHLSTEDKFENGDFFDIGETRRRHVVAKSVGLIGKEANKVGPTGEPDPVASAEVTFQGGASV